MPGFGITLSKRAPVAQGPVHNPKLPPHKQSALACYHLYVVARTFPSFGITLLKRAPVAQGPVHNPKLSPHKQSTLAGYHLYVVARTFPSFGITLYFASRSKKFSNMLAERLPASTINSSKETPASPLPVSLMARMTKYGTSN